MIGLSSPERPHLRGRHLQLPRGPHRRYAGHQHLLRRHLRIGGGALAAGASCSISVTFTPAALGSASGTLTITDDAGTQTVPLTGSGSAPVTFSSNSLNFGSMAVGEATAAKTVTVTNREKITLNFSGIAASGPFAIASNTCGAGIAANASCTVGVTFTPTAPGSASGALTFTDDALTSPQAVSLSGTGTAPVTLSSSSLSFNTTVVGATSSAKTVTLTNHQNVALSFTSVTATAGFNLSSNTRGASIAAGASCTSSAKSVTLTNHLSSALSFSSMAVTASFAIASNTCGASVAANSSCSVSVTFKPTAVGTVTGKLKFTDSALNSPQVVNLTGTGK